MNEKWLSTKEAAAYLSVDDETVLRWYRQGRVKGCKIGRLVRFQPSDLDIFARRENKAAGKVAP